MPVISRSVLLSVSEQRDAFQGFALPRTQQLFGWVRPMAQVEIVQEQIAFQKLQRFSRINAFRAHARTLSCIMATERASPSTCNFIALLTSVIATVRVVTLRCCQLGPR